MARCCTPRILCYSAGFLILCLLFCSEARRSLAMPTCLADLPPDALLHVCSFLGLENIINISYACKATFAFVRHSTWLWHLCCSRALPNSALRQGAQAGQWHELFRILHKSTLGPSSKVGLWATSLASHHLLSPLCTSYQANATIMAITSSGYPKHHNCYL
mgnify:CR=1 FL=1